MRGGHHNQLNALLDEMVYRHNRAIDVAVRNTTLFSLFLQVVKNTKLFMWKVQGTEPSLNMRFDLVWSIQFVEKRFVQLKCKGHDLNVRLCKTFKHGATE